MVGLSILISAALAFVYVPMWRDDVIVPGPGVTQVKWLSDYVPELKGTLGDTRVFILEGEEPGANILILSGHHADEPGGWMAGMLLVEHAKVNAGKLVIIPQANNSGFTHNYPQEAHARFIRIPLPDGSERIYRHGSRTGNSADHWPDPEVFVQFPSGQKLSGDEVRNLNRAYPGRLSGTFTERIALGIRTVAEKEMIDMQIDMHEAQPEYPFVNAISAHPAAVELMIMALTFSSHDIDYGQEMAPAEFRGLSNRELGDWFTGVQVNPEQNQGLYAQQPPARPYYAYVMETANVEQGKIRGITDRLMPVEGLDAFYAAAAKLPNVLRVAFDERGWSLDRRVGRHLTAVLMLAEQLADPMFEGKAFTIEGVPDYDEVIAHTVGSYLHNAEKVEPMPWRAFPGIWRLASPGK